MVQAEKKPKEHWFREHAEATEPKFLLEVTMLAIKAVLHVKEEDKLSDIEQIIEIYEDILKEGRASGKQG